MVKEMKAIEKKKAWKMVNLLQGKNVISLKWVFKTNFTVNGSIQKHKACLVAQGYVSKRPFLW